MDIRTIAKLVLTTLAAGVLAAGCRSGNNGGATAPDTAVSDASVTDSAQRRFAVVELSVFQFRAEPDYESALETQELMGAVVEVLEESDYWRKVALDQPYVAWCTSLGLVEMSPGEIEEYEKAEKYIVTAQYGKVYAQPSKDGGIISDLVLGDLLRVVHGQKSSGFTQVMLPSGKTGFVPDADVRTLTQWQASREATPENLVKTAMQFVGIPYLWGGMSPKGFDCSGLVRTVYAQNGVRLPRNASQMARLGEDVPLDGWHEGRPEALRAGDLLFFGRRTDEGDKVTHVGMYIGEGRFIHASHVVRVNSLADDAPDRYENAHKLLFAKRILFPTFAAQLQTNNQI